MEKHRITTEIEFVPNPFKGIVKVSIGNMYVAQIFQDRVETSPTAGTWFVTSFTNMGDERKGVLVSHHDGPFFFDTIEEAKSALIALLTKPKTTSTEIDL